MILHWKFYLRWSLFFGIISFCPSCITQLRKDVTSPPLSEGLYAKKTASESIKQLAEDRPELKDGMPDFTKELTLSDLIDVSLTNNPDTKRAWRAAKSSYFLLEESKAALYPTLTADLRTARVKMTNLGNGSSSNSSTGANASTIGSTAIAKSDMTPLPPTPDTTTTTTSTSSNSSNSTSNLPDTKNVVFTYYERKLSLTYLLLDFGGRSAQILSSQQALIAANWSRNRTIQSVLINTIQSYFDYLNQKALCEANICNVEDSKVNLQAAQKLFEHGLTTKSDVLQARANLASQMLNLETSKGQLNIALESVKKNIGLPNQQELHLAGLPANMPLQDIENELTDLIKKAKTLRPDLAATYAILEQKRADVLVAQSNNLPTLSAFGNIDQIRYRHNVFQKWNYYAGGLDLSIPLFEGFLSKNQILDAKEQVGIAECDVADSEANVILDVVTSYYNFKTAISNYTTTEDFLRYSQEAYNLNLGSYKNGTKSLLDVLSAQGVLANARAQYALARTLWLNSLAAISYATGELTEDAVSYYLWQDRTKEQDACL
jgi:outer membrane protein